MTLHKETRTRPAKQEEVTTAIECDLCHKETGKWGNWESETNSIGDFSETEITLTTGWRYPEDSCYTKTEYHLCRECFQTRLVPWMEEQGAEATISESDF